MALTGRIVSERAYYNYQSPKSPPIVELTVRTPHGKLRLKRVAASKPYCFCRKRDFNPQVEQAIRWIMAEHHAQQEEKKLKKETKTVWDPEPLFVPLSKEEAIVFGSKDDEVVQIFTNDKQQVKLIRDYLKRFTKREGQFGDYNFELYDHGFENLNRLIGDKQTVDLLEADITYTRRWKIDNGIYNKVKVTDEAFEPYSGEVPLPEVGYWDLETNDSRGKPKPGTDEVRAAAVSKQSKEWAIAEDNEADTLSITKGVLDRHVDVLIGWGSRKFDIDVFTKRIGNLSRSAGPDGKPLLEKDPWFFSQFQLIDLLEVLYDEGRIEGYVFDSYRLEQVVNEVLVKHGIYPKTIERPGDYEGLYQNNRERLREINLSHARAVRDLDRILGFTDLKIALADLAGIEIEDTAYTNRMVDTLIMRSICNQKPRLVVECRKHDVAEGESYGGAMCFEPTPGLFHNILHFDVVSMYVRIIQAFNVSPELWWKAKEAGLSKPEGLNLEDTTDPNVIAYFDKLASFFSKQPLGVFPLEIAKANVVRQRIKDEMNANKQKLGTESVEYKRSKAQYQAIKGILNAFYGLIGSPSSRFYQHELAGLIPWAGREIIIAAKKAIEAEFPEATVLYGDTDSVFVLAPEALGEAIKKFLNEDVFPELYDYRWGVPKERQLAEIGFEEIDADIYFTEAKKRYFYRIRDPKTGKAIPRIEVVGLETIRADACPISRETQERILNMVLDGASMEEMKAFLKDVKKRILDGEVPKEKFVMARGMRREASTYVHKPLFVKAYDKMKAMGEEVQGKVNFVVTKATKSKVLDVEPVMDFEHIPEMDTGALTYYWLHYVLPPADRVIMLPHNELEELKYVPAHLTDNLDTKRLTDYAECS